MRKISILVITLLVLFASLHIPMEVKAETILPLQTNVSGILTEQNPINTYTVVVKEEGVLTIHAKAYFKQAILELRDTNNERIGKAHDIFMGWPENPTSSSMDYYVGAGTYTVIIRNPGETNNAKYELNVSLEPVRTTENEPNQTFSEAMPIQVNQDRVKGFINWTDRKDFYKVKLDRPGRLVIHMDSKMTNATFTLYDEKEEKIFSEDVGYFVDLPILWEDYADLEAGTYYIEVAGNKYWQGVYEINTIFQPIENQDFEPNDSKETAKPIQLNDLKTHIGFLSHQDKIDYYKIEMNYDGSLTIDFTSEDIKEYQLVDAEDRSYSYFSGGNWDQLILSSEKIELRKGTYYLVVSKEYSRMGGTYKVSFKAEPAFKDTAGRYQSAVTYLTDRGVANGLSKNEFGVQQNIKRVDAAIWLAKILNLNMADNDATPYKDVPIRAWGAVNALKKKNIVNGKTNTHFGANDTMTRGEMALLIQRAYRLSGDGEKLLFTDVSPRYEKAVQALLKNNITYGKSYYQFGTDLSITRGEMALFLHRANMK